MSSPPEVELEEIPDDLEMEEIQREIDRILFLNALPDEDSILNSGSDVDEEPAQLTPAGTSTETEGNSAWRMDLWTTSPLDSVQTWSDFKDLKLDTALTRSDIGPFPVLRTRSEPCHRANSDPSPSSNWAAPKHGDWSEDRKSYEIWNAESEVDVDNSTSRLTRWMSAPIGHGESWDGVEPLGRGESWGGVEPLGRGESWSGVEPLGQGESNVGVEPLEHGEFRSGVEPIRHGESSVRVETAGHGELKE